MDIRVTDKESFFAADGPKADRATMPLAPMLSTQDERSVERGRDIGDTIYAFSLTTAIRFIPVFTAAMAGIIEAQTARGVSFDTRNIFKKIGLIFPLCVPLLVTSVRKIEGAAISAELRGFNLRKRESGYKNYPIRAADIGVFLFAVTVAVLGVIVP